MKALAVCATYGRLPYLGRMLSSFIHQTYDDKHLVVINDDPNVELCCNRKDVTVINCNQRLLLSHKRNMGICSGYYDIIFPWDDDDIALPLRIENHMKQYSDGVDAYRNNKSYIIYGDEFKIDTPPPNSMSYRKSTWFDIGGYKTTGFTGEDVDLYNSIKNLKIDSDEESIDFVYQFGGLNYHLSIATQEDIDAQALEQLNNLRLRGGKFWIEPDFEQYNNICMLDKLYRDNPETLLIRHISDSKIDINHLI